MHSRITEAMLMKSMAAGFEKSIRGPFGSRRASMDPSQPTTVANSPPKHSTPPRQEVIAEIEDALRELQAWTFTSAEGYAAQPRIEWLDRYMSANNLDVDLLGRAIQRLQALCKHSGRLPPSCTLPDHVALVGTGPVSSSALSDVYRGFIGNEDVALKVLRIHADNQHEVQKIFRHEVILWKFLKHPNIAPFLGVTSMFHVCIVSRWMEHGTVSAYLQEHSTVSRLALIRDVTRGLNYMHSLQVVHGDLKASNVLVKENGRACLTDFGLATLVYDTGNLTGTSSLRGTLRWMSPELLSSEDSGRPTYASDVYALSMLLWELMTGNIPFYEIRQDMVVMSSILAGKRPLRPALDLESANELDDDIWDLMQRCWQADPTLRPATSSIHWFGAFVFTPKASLSRANAVTINTMRSRSFGFEVVPATPSSEADVSSPTEWSTHAGELSD